MNLESSLAPNTSAAEVAPFERAHSPATTFATAQAFVSHTPSASNATTRGLAGTAECDASVSDYHEAEEASDTEGAILKSGDLCSEITGASKNFMTRRDSGDGDQDGMNFSNA